MYAIVTISMFVCVCVCVCVADGKVLEKCSGNLFEVIIIFGVQFVATGGS